MRKLVVLLTLVLFVTACGNKGGGIGGGGSRRGFEAQPEDMVLIPAGSFLMGSNDEDVMWAMNSSPKQKTTDAFWMDQTEVTNLRYRRFVNWTADSIARRMLANEEVEGFYIEEEDEYEDDTDPSEYLLNYRTRIALNPKQRGYDEHYPVLKENGFFYSKQEALGQKRLIDSRKLYYQMHWYDLQQAAKSKWDPTENRYIGKVTNMQGETSEVVDRSSFIMKEDIPVYPDTLAWIRDFDYSYNEPMATSYFWHPAYDYYPVVGVTWKQAMAFCDWRSKHAREKTYKNQYKPHNYRLPMEVEFEYASRGGLPNNFYPWGSMYSTNQFGCYLANFKPQRGDYALDGFSRTAPTASYEPNDFGLYDMAGNVAEWVNDAYDENTYEATHDLVPTYHYHAKENDKINKKRKVIRGGSWKDISYFMQCGARDYEYQDSARTYIGFRTVRDAFITSLK